MYQIALNIFRYVLYGVCVIPTLYLLANGLAIDTQPWSCYLILAINLYMCLEASKNTMLFIVFFIIGLSNYSIIYANFINTIQNTFYTKPINDDVTNISLNILLLFNVFLLYLINWKRIECSTNSVRFIKDDKACTNVLILLSVILVIVFFVGFSLPKTEGARGTPKPIYEYALSFFICFFYYSGGAKNWIRFGIIMVLMFAFQNFVFGGRIFGLQFLTVVFIMLYMKRINTAKLMMGISFFFVAFTVIGAARGNIMSGNYNVADIIGKVYNKGFALDTAYSAYFTSETFVFLTLFFPWSLRLHLFLQFVIAIFLGENHSGMLGYISRDYVHHNFGGIMPFYFYFYIGVAGILVSALISSVYLRLVATLRNTDLGYFKCLSVYVVCHAFRWYLYSPLGLFRGVLFLSLVYLLCRQISALK